MSSRYDRRSKSAYVDGCRTISDDFALNVLDLWQQSFPDAELLKMPSHNNGIAVITHTLGLPPMQFNGRESLSPLANAALYSFEISDERFLNLYEAILPDIPGKSGQPSTTQVYAAALNDKGIIIDGDHYHWKGAKMMRGEHGIFAIHHSDSADPMSPMNFSRYTIRALKKAVEVINQRSSH